ncbi:phage adaptor protein [Noviluteimonas gilva]|uniref:Uncharacterized protein n=1 Tax=Noviluteimonas gilva TaxID=2682097 RepID=A0A7C9M0E0_9GAMM|nr:hypothetical protein [Lysobacter gilvus]MUV13588.1 hypothetical protein [Lysobacter gilvus]
MQFASYTAFRNSLLWLIEGDELATTFSHNTADLIIGLGEDRVYSGDRLTPGLRASSMVSDLSVAVASNAAALPADLLELKEVFFSGEPPLEVIPLDRLRALEADGSSTGAQARVCAQDGDTLRFWPVASGTALGSYYAKPATFVDLPDVDWGDATTLARYPALFIYAALFEAALFLGMVEKGAAWETRYRQLADGANHAEAMRVYGGSPLRMRAR